MKCEKCQTEMRIIKSRYASDGKTVISQILACRNKNCTECGTEIEKKIN